MLIYLAFKYFCQAVSDCPHHFGCLSCEHHRVTLIDKPKIEAHIKTLNKDKEIAVNKGKARRIEQINLSLEFYKSRLKGLEQLETKVSSRNKDL